jgi:hypothetical protein
MNLQVAMQGGDRITKQRNLFLVLTIALSITSGALSLKILAQEERIIMVPPLSSEVMISNRKVSSGYLAHRNGTCEKRNHYPVTLILTSF